jgi:hypothetical protein
VDAAILEHSLAGPLQGRNSGGVKNPFVIFDAFKIGCPNRANGKRVLDLVQSLLPQSDVPLVSQGAVANIFRSDLFDRAVEIYRSKNRELTGEKGESTPACQIIPLPHDPASSGWSAADFSPATVSAG